MMLELGRPLFERDSLFAGMCHIQHKLTTLTVEASHEQYMRVIAYHECPFCVCCTHSRAANAFLGKISACKEHFVFFSPNIYLSFCHLLFVLDVCRSPAQVPKFEWINKYKKAIKSQESVKQFIAPLEEFSNKVNQHQEMGLSSPFYLLRAEGCEKLQTPDSSLSLNADRNDTQVSVSLAFSIVL